MPFSPSDRMKRLPPYLFAEFERKRAVLEKQGKDIVNLGIGDPDQPPPKLLLDTMVAHLGDEGVHQYSSSQGIDEFRSAVAGFMKKRYGLARALKKIEPALESILRAQGLLTRDPRMKERKKYGLRGARRGVQYSKR